MRSFDKGHITFVFDDGKMPFTQAMADLFIGYGMPMSAATIANNVTEGNELYNELVKIEENGGEILSHGYEHKAITSSTAAQIFSILKANPDTIKAVFTGHHHSSYNTNILADGGKTIPQYVFPASYQNFVACIEMK